MPKQEQDIKVIFLGDVMLGRLVNDILEIKPENYVWGNTLPILKTSDLNIINLEFAITKNEEKWIKTFNYKLDPEKINTLKIAEIDFANIANNHVLDYMEQGLIDTIDNLDKIYIKHSGAGKNINEAKKPVIFDIKNTKIAIISFADHYEEWLAIKNNSGINYIPVNESGLEEAKKQIKEAKKNNDIVIFSIHWGPNMQQYPSKEFIEFAHNIIDSGVDIFYGHSAHIFQGVEVYKGKVIFYDTGDFVDDYYVDPILRNDQSFIFIVTLSKNKIKKIELIPTIISEMQVNVAKDDNAEEIINKMISLSKEFNTKFKKEKDYLTIEI